MLMLVCLNDHRSDWLSADAVCIPVLQVLGLKLPNMLGRAEKLTFQFSYGTKETSYGLSFFKPQPGHFERKYVHVSNFFCLLDTQQVYHY